MSASRRLVRVVVFGVLLAFVVGVTPAYAAPVVTDSYPESNASPGIFERVTGYACSQVAQAFTASVSGRLHSAQFQLARNPWGNEPDGPAYAVLYAHSGTYGVSSLPVEPALAVSEPVDAATLTDVGIANLPLVTFTFDQSVYLAAGRRYMIAVKYEGGDADLYRGTLWMGIDASAPTHPGDITPYLNLSAPLGSLVPGWNAGLRSWDATFYVYVDPNIFSDPETGLTVVLPEGATPGVTTVTPVDQNSPGPPTGFRFVGNTACFDITSTAVLPPGGLATITIPYDDADVRGQEGNIKVQYWDGHWHDITPVTIDTVNNVVTFQTSHLSIYGLVELLPPDPVATPASSLWSLALIAGLGLGAVLVVPRRRTAA